MCTGSVPPNISGLATVSVQWQLGGIKLTNSTLEGVIISNSELMATLNFSFLDNDTHERDYLCVATLSITGVPITRNSNTTYTLMTLSKFNIIISFRNSKACVLHV